MLKTFELLMKKGNMTREDFYNKLLRPNNESKY